MTNTKQKEMSTVQKMVAIPLTAGILAFGGAIRACQPKAMPYPKTQIAKAIVEVRQANPVKALKQDLSSLQRQVHDLDANRAQTTLGKISKDLNALESSKKLQNNISDKAEAIGDVIEVQKAAKAAIESLKTEQRMQNTVNANQEGIAKERLAVGIKSEALDSAINNAEKDLSSNSCDSLPLGVGVFLVAIPILLAFSMLGIKEATRM